MGRGDWHFVGIGGIGMSAIARILLQRGESVSGSDLKESPLLDRLRAEGGPYRDRPRCRQRQRRGKRSW